MDRQDVPQDAVATYGGLRKLMYAVDEDGHYGGVTSSGWEAESFATELAVSELRRQTEEAWQRARNGATAPLEYHMLARRMDFDTLVHVTGLWRWRVRRHLRPAVFARLPERVLRRYAEALDMDIASLRQLPPAP